MTKFPMIYLEEIDSTNRYAADNFAALADAALVVAGSQTAGRGRFNRRWVSPPNENVYASFAVKNFPHPIHKASWIGSLAVLDAFAVLFPDLSVWLKWPNDIYCGERKIAGLLCEGVAGRQGFDGAVIGIGVNINMPAEATEAIDQPATSVLRETGTAADLNSFIATLHECLIRRYIDGIVALNSLYEEWKKRNFILGRRIELVAGADQQVISGKVVDIGGDGELLFDTGTAILKFFSCDVKISKNSLFEKKEKNTASFVGMP